MYKNAIIIPIVSISITTGNADTNNAVINKAMKIIANALKKLYHTIALINKSSPVSTLIRF